jgi:predicted aminopeptidase
MDPKQIAKLMIQFNKTAFDNTFYAMNDLQEQQSPWMPAEGKKAVTDWIKAYKRGREDFKAAVDDNYKKVEDFFADADNGKVEDFLVNIKKTRKAKEGK